MMLIPFKITYTLASVLYLFSLPLYFIEKRIGFICIFIGLMINIIALVIKGYFAGQMYLYPMFEETYLLPAALAGLILLIKRKGYQKETFALIIPLIICTLIALFTPYEPFIPTAKIQAWSLPLFFFLFETSSSALFISAGALAIASFRSELKNEKIYSPMIIWGFILFTLCQIIGAIWSYIGWSYPFSWNPRHLVSASIWCIYAAYIHAHLIQTHWKIKKGIAVLGIIFITYMVYHHQIVNLIKYVSGDVA